MAENEVVDVQEEAVDAAAPDTHDPAPPVNKSADWIGKFIALLIVLFIGSVLFGLVKPGTFFESLRDPEFARGVITFMVAMAAITLGFTVVLCAFFGAADSQSEARFRRAREIFVAMMGVLGTIVGYYFGQEGSAVEPLDKPAIKIVEDKTAMIRVTGGEAPYSYAVNFTQRGEDPIDPINAVSTDGWIDLTLPAKGAKDFTLVVRDAKNQTVSSEYKP